MNTFRRGVLLCLLLAATAACDRVTKHFAMTSLAGSARQSFLADTLRFDYYENPGGFLGAGAGWQPHRRALIFQLANTVFLLTVFVTAGRYQWSRFGVAGIALFLAGALSNQIDRIALGQVIDFMNIGIGSLRTGIFNVADVAIMAGVAVVLFDQRRTLRATW